MSQERMVQEAAPYAAPTLAVDGRMVVPTAQATKNHVNVNGSKP